MLIHFFLFRIFILRLEIKHLAGYIVKSKLFLINSLEALEIFLYHYLLVLREALLRFSEGLCTRKEIQFAWLRQRKELGNLPWCGSSCVFTVPSPLQHLLPLAKAQDLFRILREMVKEDPAGGCGKETYKHINLHNPHFSRSKTGIFLILSQQQLLGWTVENKEDYLDRDLQFPLLRW